MFFCFLAHALAADHVVAIAPFATFTSDADLAPFGAGLADMLTSDLAPSPDLTVVERSKIETILDELELQQSAWTDPATAARLGKGMGATEVLVGSLSESQGTVRLDVRLVDVELATVRQTIDVEGPKEDVFRLERTLAIDLLESLGAEIPAEHRKRLSARGRIAEGVGLGFSDDGPVLSVVADSKKTKNTQLWVDGVEVGVLSKKEPLSRGLVVGTHEVAVRIPNKVGTPIERVRCWGVIEIGPAGLDVPATELCKAVRPGLPPFGTLLWDHAVASHSILDAQILLNMRVLWPGTFLVEPGVHTLSGSGSVTTKTVVEETSAVGPVAMPTMPTVPSADSVRTQAQSRTNVDLCREPVTLKKGEAYVLTVAAGACRATPIPLD